MKSGEFLSAVKRAITVPTYQPRFSETDLLDLANEEQRTLVVPMITSLREDYFIVRETQAVASGTSKIEIPTRAIGRTLRDVLLAQSNSLFASLPRISLEDSYMWRNRGTGTPSGFFILDDSFELLPSPSAPCTLEVLWAIQPSKIVLETRASDVVSVGTDTVVLTRVPSNITVGSLIDITMGRAGYRTIYRDVEVLNISGTTLTLDGFTVADPIENVRAGDSVSTAFETSVIQMPDEARDVLIQATAVRVLEALSIPDQLESAQRIMDRKIRACRELMTPRVEGALQKIINRNGLLRGRSSNRRYPNVLIP